MSKEQIEYRKKFMAALINDFKEHALEQIENGFLDEIEDHVDAFEILAENFSHKLSEIEHD